MLVKLICVCFILIFLFYKYKKTSKIIFYSSDILAHKIFQTLYDYYYFMSNENLKLRGISDINSYLSDIHRLFYTCSYYEQEIIKRAVHKANKRINNLNYVGFYPYKLNNIPWIFGFSNSNEYEFGLPHTQGMIIILNKNNIYLKDLVTLLIHERIHIYQKLFTNDVDEFIEYYNFQKISKKNNNDRTNPDTNDFLYKRFNQIYECKITGPQYTGAKNSDSSKVICTNNDPKYEHPFEYMAYVISESNCTNPGY